MPNSKNGAKSAEKIPVLIVFGRIHGSNKVNQAAVFLKKMPNRRRRQLWTPGCRTWKCKPKNTVEP